MQIHIQRLQGLEHSAEGAQPGSRGQEGNLLHAFGVVQRQAVDRAASIAYSPCGTMLGVLSAGKALELFRWAVVRPLVMRGRFGSTPWQSVVGQSCWCLLWLLRHHAWRAVRWQGSGAVSVSLELLA